MLEGHKGWRASCEMRSALPGLTDDARGQTGGRNPSFIFGAQAYADAGPLSLARYENSLKDF
jgi:hypothetical protein